MKPVLITKANSGLETAKERIKSKSAQLGDSDESFNIAQAEKKLAYITPDWNQVGQVVLPYIRVNTQENGLKFSSMGSHTC